VAESKPSKTSDSLKKLLTESILYEDKGLLVINKPSGLAVHGGRGIDVGTPADAPHIGRAHGFDAYDPLQ
jgi:23S rRNA-/tRNA-specific pseudouridylate synthase